MKRLSFGLMVITFTVYGIMAAEHGFYLFSPKAPQLWHEALELWSNSDYVRGEGSVYLDQTALYVKNRGALIFHTFFGGSALLLGLLQLWPKLQLRKKLHRNLGILYLSAATISMVGASRFLLAIDTSEAYSGITFYWGLAGLCITTWEVLFFLTWTVVTKNFHLHRQYALLSYAFLATAPILRLGWMLGSPFGSQDIVNISISMFLVPLCLFPCNLLVPDSHMHVPEESSTRRKLKFLLPTLAFIVLFFLASLPQWWAGTSPVVTMSYAIPFSISFVTALTLCLKYLKNNVLSKKWLVFTMSLGFSPLLALAFYWGLTGTYDHTNNLAISLMMSYAVSIYLGHKYFIHFHLQT